MVTRSFAPLPSRTSRSRNRDPSPAASGIPSSAGPDRRASLHQPLRAFELREHGARLGRGQHHRQPRRTLGPLETFDPLQLPLENIPIQEQNRRKRLILRGRGYVSLHGQMSKISGYFGFAHLRRVPSAVEQNETP